MGKLKCWKKVDAYSGEQWNNKNGDRLQVDYGSKKYYVQNVNLSKKGGGRMIKNSIQSKSQALKVATKYMKEHDKC